MVKMKSGLDSEVLQISKLNEYFLVALIGSVKRGATRTKETADCEASY